MKFLNPSDTFRKVKARTEKSCTLCTEQIHGGEIYYQYIEKDTGYEKKACFRHLDEKMLSGFYVKRQQYTQRRAGGECIRLETDASGVEGERWSFVAYVNQREKIRKHGLTPSEITDITPAEGFAVLRAIEWLRNAEKRGLIPNNLPVIVGSDNAPVMLKLKTQFERGSYYSLWHKLNQALLPYRREARLFVEGGSYDQAHGYAQNSSFEHNTKRLNNGNTRSRRERNMEKYQTQPEKT